VAGLCKDAAGLSVPLGDGWSAPRLWGLLAGKPTLPLRRRPLASGVRWWVILLAATPMGRAKSTGRWFVVGGRRVTPLKEALTALADVLAKRPAQEILFDWFRSGRLVGELSVLIKRRHPEVQAEIDRVYQEHLATLGKRRRDPAAQDD
jgi:hypothetical protein